MKTYDGHGLMVRDGQTYFSDECRAQDKRYRQANYSVTKAFSAPIHGGFKPSNCYYGSSRISLAVEGAMQAVPGDEIFYTRSGEAFLVKKETGDAHAMLGKSTGRGAFERGPLHEAPTLPADCIAVIAMPKIKVEKGHWLHGGKV